MCKLKFTISITITSNQQQQQHQQHNNIDAVVWCGGGHNVWCTILWLVVMMISLDELMADWIYELMAARLMMRQSLIWLMAGWTGCLSDWLAYVACIVLMKWNFCVKIHKNSHWLHTTNGQIWKRFRTQSHHAQLLGKFYSFIHTSIQSVTHPASQLVI